MKSFIVIVGMIAGGLCMCSNAEAQEAEATKIHAEIKDLDEQTARELGFQSEDGLRGSTLGSPIKVFMSGLDEVEKFRGGNDPHQLLVDTREVIYPIYANGEFQGSVTLVQRNGKWELATFGGAEAKLSESSRSKHMKSNRQAKLDYVAVHMPALQQLFVGFDQQGKLFLIPCHKNDLIDLKVDIPMPAEAVVLAMQPLVAKFRNVLSAPEKMAVQPGQLATGKVLGVLNPGDAAFAKYTPDFGDRIDLSTFSPQNDDNKDLGLVRGKNYNLLMLTGKEKQQAFVYWETTDPKFEAILKGKQSKIASMGRRGFGIQKGDTVTIQAQPSSEGGIDVTFSYFHAGKSIGTTSFIVGTNPTPTPPAPIAQAGFPKGYFYMTTKSAQGQDLVLESEPLTLRKRGTFNGMAWKADRDDDGTYFLTSRHLEKTQGLEGDDGQKAASMQPKSNVTGMSWKAVPAGGGYYYLTTLASEPGNKVLDGSVGDADGAEARFKGAPYMVDKKSAGPSALWKFIPIPTE